MIIVPGSVNADLLFKVQRLPRPGETVLCPSYVMAPGGKGANQAAAAAKAGAAVAFVGHVGADAYGPVVRGLLLEAGVGCDLLAVATAPTAIAVIGVDAGGENAIIVASGANLETAAAQVPDAMLGAGATVLCQNEIRPAETFAVLSRAKRLGARTVLNMAPAASVPPEVLGALDVLVVNELEAETVAGVTGQPPETVARALATTYGLTCVVTLGGAGCIAVTAAEGWRVPVLPITPVGHHRRRRRLRRRAHRLAGRRRRPGRVPARRQRRRRLQLRAGRRPDRPAAAGGDPGPAARAAAGHRAVTRMVDPPTAWPPNLP